MKTILRISIVWLLLNPSCLIGQDGFIKTFVSPDTLISRIQNVVYSNDNNSLILAGIAQDRETTLQGIWLVKFDTLGNLLKDTIHLDLGSDDYPRHEFLPLITTSDSGYIYLTSLFFGKQIVVTKFDNNLKVVFSKILAEDFSKIRNPGFNNIFEVDDGFILHLRKQHINFKGKNHLVKLDKEGNFLWEKEYGDDERNYHGRSVSTLVDDKIFITGSRGSVNGQDVDHQQYIWELDIEGTLLNEFYFPPEQGTEFVILGPIVFDSQENIIAETSVEIFFENNLGPKSRILEISKFDPDYELIWSRQFGPDLQHALADLPTITIDEDDNILASGNLVADDGAANPSILMMLSPDGETLWERRDTLFIGENDSPQSFSLHDTEKHIVLPSGSIVMVGTTTPNSDHDAPQQGYIIKVDKNGCIEPGCREVVSTVDISSVGQETIIYPNPATYKLNVVWDKEKGHDVQFEIYSVNRTNSLSGKIKLGTQIDVSHLTTGLYFMTLKYENGEESTHKILIVR